MQFRRATIIKAVLAVAGTIAAGAPGGVQAQVPGPHPAYLHALADLRAARHYLQDIYGPSRKDCEAATQEIDAAIREIKHAVIDDGKDNDPLPMNSNLIPHDRFGKANELLAAAHHDLEHAEDVPEARGLRDRAIGHIDRAHQIVDAAWRKAH